MTDFVGTSITSPAIVNQPLSSVFCTDTCHKVCHLGQGHGFIHTFPGGGTIAIDFVPRGATVGLDDGSTEVRDRVNTEVYEQFFGPRARREVAAFVYTSVQPITRELFAETLQVLPNAALVVPADARRMVEASGPGSPANTVYLNEGGRVLAFTSNCANAVVELFHADGHTTRIDRGVAVVHPKFAVGIASQCGSKFSYFLHYPKANITNVFKNTMDISKATVLFIDPDELLGASAEKHAFAIQNYAKDECCNNIIRYVIVHDSTDSGHNESQPERVRAALLGENIRVVDVRDIEHGCLTFREDI